MWVKKIPKGHICSLPYEGSVEIGSRWLCDECMKYYELQEVVVRVENNIPIEVKTTWVEY